MNFLFSFIFILINILLAPNALATEAPAKLQLLDFWGSWCSPCKTSFPEIEKLHLKYKSHVEFLGVNQDRDEKDMLDFLKSTPVSFSQTRDTDRSILKKHSIKALPTTILLDRNGKEVFRLRGYRDSDHQKIEAAIKSALDQNTSSQATPLPK